MCWTGDNKSHLMTAKTDIIVYKFGFIANDFFMPLFYNDFHYEKGCLNKYIELKIKHLSAISYDIYVDKGYHSYGTKATPDIGHL